MLSQMMSSKATTVIGIMVPAVLATGQALGFWDAGVQEYVLSILTAAGLTAARDGHKKGD